MVVVIIEGGGETRAEQTQLRQGFSALFDKVMDRRQPRPKPLCAGGRGNAFKDFCKKLDEGGETCLLLVDSEGPVKPGASPWQHVAERDGDHWQRPSAATDQQLHFMVEAMEAWLAADPAALALYYGSEFKENKLPKRANLEEHPKADLISALEAATKEAKTKDKYCKSHGFDLIGMVDPAKIRRACPTFAVRFFNELRRGAGG